jgi:hypothetical protein
MRMLCRHRIVVLPVALAIAVMLPEAAMAFGWPPGPGGGGGGGGGGAGGAPLPLLGATLLGQAGLAAGGYLLWRKHRRTRR